MRQYCPVCKQLYESDTRFCPECDVVMYMESSYLSRLKSNIKMNIVTHKKINAMLPLGIVLIIVGVIVAFLCMGIVYLYEIAALGIVLGVITVIVGICFVGNNLKYTQKVPNSNDILHIKCPYCNSDNTEKITSASRTGAFIVYGMGSGKIGKQWHCNNCKSDF